MYLVVTRTKVTGVITQTNYDSKAQFDSYNNHQMKDWYEIIEEGVTKDRADWLCNTDENKRAIALAHLKEVSNIFEGL